MYLQAPTNVNTHPRSIADSIEIDHRLGRAPRVMGDREVKGHFWRGRMRISDGLTAVASLTILDGQAGVPPPYEHQAQSQGTPTTEDAVESRD